jgi:hypothetical protein
MTGDEMVKRVAAAIQRHQTEFGPDYEGMARAAIEALRQPNRKMLRAAAKAMSPGRRPTQARVGCMAKHGIRYRAMIDAALGEPNDAGASPSPRQVESASSREEQ